MDIARIDKATGLVVNIEVVDAEWLDAHADDPEYLFVPYTEDAPASIGLSYDPVNGFERPAVPEDTITLTEATIAALALTAKQQATLAAHTAREPAS